MRSTRRSRTRTLLDRPPSARAGQSRHPRHGHRCRQRAPRRTPAFPPTVHRRRTGGDDHLRAARHQRRSRVVHRLGPRRRGDRLRLRQGRPSLAGRASINMSLGQNGGSHDGESVVEQRRRPAARDAGPAPLSRGRQRARLARHAVGHPATGPCAPCSGGPAAAAVPGGAPPPPARTAPQRARGLVLPARRAAHPADQPDRRGHHCRRARREPTHQFAERQQRLHRLRPVLPAQRRRADLIAVDPGTAQRVDPGVWQVELDAGPARVGRFDAWIERDARDATNNSPTSRSSSEPTSTR